MSILCSSGGDCWRAFVVNKQLQFEVKDEGKMFTPLYLENAEAINADLVIDGDTSRRIKMGFSSPLAMGDTIRIDLFDNEEAYAHLFEIFILKDKYLIRYSREINYTDVVQVFVPIKSHLELNSSNFIYGSKIRGRVSYLGRCISGCSDKDKQIRIEGNFAVAM